MSWEFCPALPLTGGSDPGGYVRGFMSANLLGYMRRDHCDAAVVAIVCSDNYCATRALYECRCKICREICAVQYDVAVCQTVLDVDYGTPSLRPLRHDSQHQGFISFI